jgi:hypothetical protein
METAQDQENTHHPVVRKYRSTAQAEMTFSAHRVPNWIDVTGVGKYCDEKGEGRATA